MQDFTKAQFNALIDVDQLHLHSGQYLVIYIHKGNKQFPVELHITDKNDVKIVMRDEDLDKVEITTFEKAYPLYED
jgi:hypothetical protein